ncbi:hypothetical protein QQ045_029044 [Rhodiola kirilowii]
MNQPNPRKPWKEQEERGEAARCGMGSRREEEEAWKRWPLDPKELRTSVRVDDICKLVEKIHPTDFDEDERRSLRVELQHFEMIRQLPDLNTLTEISELCQWLARTRKSNMFILLYNVISLILTLPVSTAIVECSFSIMNIVNSALCNKMEGSFLSDSLVVNIEKDIAKIFRTD